MFVNTLEILKFKDTEDILNKENLNYRTTIIDSSGKVIYDSIENPRTMENHIDRDEVRKAVDKGTGESIRYSTTKGKDTYNYAIMLSNKSIVRVSIQISNISSVFMNIMPWVVLITLTVLFIAFIVSSILTDKIIKPVNVTSQNLERIIDGEDIEEVSIYDELLPFIRTVKHQSREIRRYIKVLNEKVDSIETIISNMEEGLILVDKDKNILSINPSAINLLGGDNKNTYTNENFMKLCRDIELNEILTQTIEVEENIDIIIKLHNKYLNLLINPIISDGYIHGMAILIVDSTEKYKLDLMRKEFSANVSHELKTPLTTINGYAEMLELGMVKDEDINKFASTIKNEGIRLLKIIDSIIRLSKIEEKTEDDFMEINIYSLAESVVKRVSKLAEEKDIKINLSGDNVVINGNKTMLDELLHNIIENSIKYTNTLGTVDVEIKKQNSEAYIKVKDTGIGIPKADQERIFERFYVVDKSRSKKINSTGLGLSIVKHIVEYHKGTINLKSEEGKGTEILIKFPLK